MTKAKDNITTRAIQALAQIDAELGLPADGHNSTQDTIAAIRELKTQVEILQYQVRVLARDDTWAYNHA